MELSKHGGPDKGRITMNFVLVNDRTPRAPSVCAHCSTPIGLGYLQDVSSQRQFCDCECYVRYSKDAARTTSLAAAGIDGFRIPHTRSGFYRFIDALFA